MATFVLSTERISSSRGIAQKREQGRQWQMLLQSRHTHCMRAGCYSRVAQSVLSTT